MSTRKKAAELVRTTKPASNRSTAGKAFRAGIKALSNHARTRSRALRKR